MIKETYRVKCRANWDVRYFDDTMRDRRLVEIKKGKIGNPPQHTFRMLESSGAVRRYKLEEV